ncbi:substrate-binding domain-containing protein, partial [Alphaproteobacteria bacterium]|nr:substrate-binding domain-containing protein [Alphaproteobacteria bacterium]
NEGFASGLHLYDYKENIWNIPLIQKELTNKTFVLMEWAQRDRGLIFKDRNDGNITLHSFRGKRLVRRQIGSGAEQYLKHVFKTQNLTYNDFQETEIAYSENDAVTLIVSELADLTLGLKSEAVKYNLSFIPLVTERFDLVINRKFWFEKPFQDLLEFCKTEEFKIMASKLEGYNILNLGKIHFNS